MAWPPAISLPVADSQSASPKTPASPAEPVPIWAKEEQGVRGQGRGCDESWKSSMQVAAMCGSLCLEGEAISLLSSLSRARLQYPNTPTAEATSSASRRSEVASSPPSRAAANEGVGTSPCSKPTATTAPHLQDARAMSPQHTFTYAYLKSARNHLSTRAGMCVCAVVALAYCDSELDEQLRSGAGDTVVQQLFRLKEWEEAREDGGSNELGEFEGKHYLLVALANLGLRCQRLQLP
jgi:hypothetical protein